MKRFVFVLSLLLFVGINLLQGQGVQVTGNVTGADDGAALPGVSVVVRGTTIGAVTDFEGNYNITVPDGSAVLMFSFVGMVTQEVSVEGRSTLDVVMESSSTELEEVVVTALGMTRSEKSLGYSVQSVEAEELSKANTSDVINSISGRTAGVQITSSSGSPGASTFMTIRGAASILGNNQPLFVIDGMPIVTGNGGNVTINRDPSSVGNTGRSSRSIDINPEDIASMTVLKGGAATALYGLRAANGAIIITTKGGTRGQKMKVDFHTSVGIDQMSQVPDMQRQYAQGNNGEWVHGFQRSYGPNVDTLEYDKPLDPSDPRYEDYEYIWDENGRIVGRNDPNANGNPVQTYDQYDFFKTGMTFNNRLSVSAGNDKASYYFSVADLEQTGIVPESQYGRTNVRLNSSARLTKWVKVSTNMAYSNSRSTMIQTGSNTSGVMLGLVRTPPTFDNAQLYEFPDGTQRTYRNGGGYDNPYWTANKNSYNEDVDRFIGNAILNFTFTEWFSASYNLGVDTYTRSFKNIIAVNSRTAPPGTLEESARTSRQINSDLLLNFHKTFGEFDASLTVGNNVFESGWKRVWGDAYGLEIPGFYSLSNSADNQTGVEQEKYRTMALFADIQLSFMDMIFLGATGRNDWSTTMPEDNRSAFYPSVSGGFVFTEIGALKGNSVLSFGKIRGSWAKTANIAEPYNTTSYYYGATARDGWVNTGVSFPYQGKTAFDVGYTLGNPGLRHETMKSFEVGADLRFLNNRIGIDFAYFQNTNEDLLLDVPIPESSGYGEIYQNAGIMESKGFEVSANASILTGEFKWDIMANFTKLTNTVVSLAEGVESVFLAGFTDPQVRAVAGQSYGSIYGYDWYRDPDTGRTLINDDPSDGERDGYPMTKYLLAPVGEVNPNWTANITNTLSYKGVRLSFMIDIRNGGLMYNGTASAMNYMGTHARTLNRDVYFTPEGTVDFVETPEENLVVFEGVYGHVDADGNPISSGNENVSPVVMDENWFEGYGSNFGGGPSIFALERTDWVRLREITLGYSIPVQKKIFQGIEVYFTGRNLWLSTPYTGIDPETNLEGAVNGQGMDYFNMPGTRTYTVGVKLSF